MRFLSGSRRLSPPFLDGIFRFFPSAQVLIMFFHKKHTNLGINSDKKDLLSETSVLYYINDI